MRIRIVVHARLQAPGAGGPGLQGRHHTLRDVAMAVAMMPMRRIHYSTPGDLMSGGRFVDLALTAFMASGL